MSALQNSPNKKSPNAEILQIIILLQKKNVSKQVKTQLYVAMFRNTFRQEQFTA